MCSTSMSPELQKSHFSVREPEQTHSKQTSVSRPTAQPQIPSPCTGMATCIQFAPEAWRPASEGGAVTRQGLGQQSAPGDRSPDHVNSPHTKGVFSSFRQDLLQCHPGAIPLV